MTYFRLGEGIHEPGKGFGEGHSDSGYACLMGQLWGLYASVCILVLC